MNNLKKFSTEADYSAATLNYPAVSWVVSGDTVHFDKSGSTPTVNDKVMMAWHSPSDVPSGKDIVLVNAGSSFRPTDYFDSLTLNDADVMSAIDGGGTLHNYSTPDTDYLAKYGLKVDSIIGNEFSGDLGGGWGSSVDKVDFLIPAQVTEIQSLPDNVGNLVVEAATPPTTSLNWCSVGSLTLYVPTDSISAYQAAWELVQGSTILPISDYQGNLPV